MADDEVLKAFEAGVEPPGGFHHAQHVRVAWCYLCRYRVPEALERFRAGLRRFADAQGSPERYHETITTAYVLLIDERLRVQGRELAWNVFASSNADLLSWNPSILDRYYRTATLRSDLARHTFVPPDEDEAPVGTAWRAVIAP